LPLSGASARPALTRDIQGRRHELIAAASTLLRRRPAELATIIRELCGTDYVGGPIQCRNGPRGNCEPRQAVADAESRRGL